MLFLINTFIRCMNISLSDISCMKTSLSDIRFSRVNRFLLFYIFFQMYIAVFKYNFIWLDLRCMKTHVYQIHGHIFIRYQMHENILSDIRCTEQWLSKIIFNNIISMTCNATTLPNNHNIWALSLWVYSHSYSDQLIMHWFAKYLQEK